jgi:hypothetical protein
LNTDKQKPDAPVPTLDVFYHRGTAQKLRAVVSDPTTNEHQVEVTQTIKSYMTGQTSKDQFVSSLRERDIAVNEKVNTLIRNTEAGNVPKFHDFGKAILRQLNGQDKYNRVDKITANNNRIVTPGHTGRAFGLASVAID